MDFKSLLDVISEARNAFTEYETGKEKSDIFNKIRAAGDACLERDELNPHIKEFLNIKDQYNFKTAAFVCRNLSLLGSKENNATVRNSLNTLYAGCKSLNEKVVENLQKRGVVSENTIKSNKIFIVHGHDNEIKIEMARFIEKIGLAPIILHEQASGSKTIIEKIEAYGDVGFAIVLYTPCDLCSENTKQPTFNYRARQNVVFEHGYFIARLGRENVAAIVKDKVETPNDISGVVYLTYDFQGAWQKDLIKELKAAGYKIDANILFE